MHTRPHPSPPTPARLRSAPAGEPGAERRGVCERASAGSGHSVQPGAAAAAAERAAPGARTGAGSVRGCELPQPSAARRELAGTCPALAHWPPLTCPKVGGGAGRGEGLRVGREPAVGGKSRTGAFAGRFRPPPPLATGFSSRLRPLAESGGRCRRLNPRGNRRRRPKGLGVNSNPRLPEPEFRKLSHPDLPGRRKAVLRGLGGRGQRWGGWDLDLASALWRGSRREFRFLAAAGVHPSGLSAARARRSGLGLLTPQGHGVHAPRNSAGTPGRVLAAARLSARSLGLESAPGAPAATKRVKVYFPLDCSEKPPRADAVPAPLDEVGRGGQGRGGEAAAPSTPPRPGNPGAWHGGDTAEAPSEGMMESVGSAGVSFAGLSGDFRLSVMVFSSRFCLRLFIFPLSCLPAPLPPDFSSSDFFPLLLFTTLSLGKGEAPPSGGPGPDQAVSLRGRGCGAGQRYRRFSFHMEGDNDGILLEQGSHRDAGSVG
nr:uncharacterized protein LOC107127192 [Macaca fascicularis]